MERALIERLAREARRANLETTGWVPSPGYSIEDEISNSWDLYVPEVLAVLNALREPLAKEMDDEALEPCPDEIKLEGGRAVIGFLDHIIDHA